MENQMIFIKEVAHFNSGKKLNINKTIIGLFKSREFGWVITEGYDGYIDFDTDYQERLTAGERLEIIDYMLNLYSQYKKDLLEEISEKGDS